MARPWQTLAAVATDEGRLELRRRGDDEFLIVVAGRVLMTSTARRSEEELGRLACAGLPADGRVLVGGLGMGFTLRAVLDALAETARVLVAELTPAIVDWCRGPLAPLTQGAVADPRVELQVADVADVIRGSSPGAYQAIVLDLYEGPYASQGEEHPVFGRAALARARTALSAGGVLAVWGEELDTTFTRRLAAAGFDASTHRKGGGGRAHIIYVGVAGKV